MNLEQRVEALELAVKALMGGEFSITGGQLFINDALTHDSSIKAASVKAAGCNNYDASIHLAITRYAGA